MLVYKDKFKSKIAKLNIRNNLILIIILSNHFLKNCIYSWNLKRVVFKRY